MIELYLVDWIVHLSIFTFHVNKVPFLYQIIKLKLKIGETDFVFIQSEYFDRAWFVGKLWDMTDLWTCDKSITPATC